MRIDSPGLTTDLDLLRLQGSTVTDHGDHLVVRTPANPTFWWGNFLLVPTAARSDEVERWTSRFVAELPDAHHRAIAFTQPGGDTEAWAAHGWDVEVDVDLATTSVPAPATAPDGILLRALETDDDWEQSAHVGGSDTPEDRRDGRLVFERRRAAAQRALVESGRARWFGAFDGDRLVANLGIVRLGDLARYQDVVTLESHRRRGIAGALVRAAGEWALEDPAVGRLVIVAEDGGPAIGLYQRAGFAEVARHVGVSRAPSPT
ncbi:GNAT family N-acetyltransferase [Terrabacter sp. LjRoot27]|uniref:GNAT family N-acetyltransferase n=1 Tax=Terrabacter sp. LjRoot27 TaxID=3342306 RepID=UPI003ECF1BD5